MNRFLLFVFDTYYPSGGAYDFFGSYPTAEEAKAAYTPTEYNNAHIAHIDIKGSLSILFSSWNFYRKTILGYTWGKEGDYDGD